MLESVVGFLQLIWEIKWILLQLLISQAIVGFIFFIAVEVWEGALERAVFIRNLLLIALSCLVVGLI